MRSIKYAATILLLIGIVMLGMEVLLGVGSTSFITQVQVSGKTLYTIDFGGYLINIGAVIEKLGQFTRQTFTSLEVPVWKGATDWWKNVVNALIMIINILIFLLNLIIWTTKILLWLLQLVFAIYGINMVNPTNSIKWFPEFVEMITTFNIPNISYIK